MISLDFTEDQRIAEAAATAFARDVARPAARAADERAMFSDALLARAWGLGLVQAAAGGDDGEQPSVLNALALEAIAAGDPALALALAAPLGFARAIAGFGSPAQRAAHLPWLCDDAPRFAAVAHCDAGWLHGAGRSTQAERAGTGWRIDGAKAMIPFAARCERFLVTAATRQGAEAFIVPADAPGVRIGPARGLLGLRATQMADVAFDGVEVPEDQRLAAGLRQILNRSRVALSAMLAGLARAVYETALPYARERIVHGEAIGRKQAVAFKLADMRIETQAMRWMALRAGSELDDGRDATRNARLAQVYAAERGVRIADEGVQIFGGHGFVRDLPLEMAYRNARSLSVLDGLVGV